MTHEYDVTRLQAYMLAVLSAGYFTDCKAITL